MLNCEEASSGQVPVVSAGNPWPTVIRNEEGSPRDLARRDDLAACGRQLKAACQIGTPACDIGTKSTMTRICVNFIQNRTDC